MKKKNVVLLFALGVVLFQGCIPSLYPLYTKDTLTKNAKVIGTWIDRSNDKQDKVLFTEEGIPILKAERKDNPGIWIFEEGSDEAYTLTYYDERGKSALFDAHLVELGGDYYFNFYPREIKTGDFEFHPEKFNDLEALHYFPVNTFAKLKIEEEHLEITMFNGDFLEKLLKQNRIRIKHEETENGYLLTATPKELQQFILKYGNDENAFPDPMILSKQ